MIETDIETIAEITARAVLKVLAEQAKAEPKPEPLGWQTAGSTARALGIDRCVLATEKAISRILPIFC